MKKKLSIIGLLSLVIVGLLAPWIVPHDPLFINLDNRLAPPGFTYLFGTDHLGRCIFSRIIYGIRVTVFAASIIMVITVMISLPLSLITGYLRGSTDNLFMRVIDGMYAIPDFVLTLAIVGMLGPSFINMIIAIVIVRWTDYVRLFRSFVIKASKEDYIAYARIAGNSHIRILSMYILPHIFPMVLVYAALDVGRIVLLISGLSFLGVGAQPPMPEWGVMLQDATGYFQVAPHVMLFPGLAIVFFVYLSQLVSNQFQNSTAKEV
ncbi:ABC transporter permease subunit [Alkalihalophilus marmarensis]|jgi:ABC-type dipeptide/oligopeptide/nickel transport system permease subunit|uniref:ABC transmembrane type-1 domain-containing protein n=1 Tax=Alkalihalophilus marmarensis DSM 21297 TaxID=1188261 RepID=U6SIP2_9BACI|nr:ABC transporter permease subunit [Alkalihalophilus marmarensis]ERN51428.1 hypothetical protein A33I_01770 [Alkalihalophilus marmarensis DSM 21297]MCM3490359.1 ABC transporter permease subunit [Alkalihalophilus marmarensis]